MDQESKTAIVNSKNGLLHYEIRDKKANTLQYKTFKEINTNAFSIPIEFDIFHQSERRMSSIELFLMDSEGNIERRKLKI